MTPKDLAARLDKITDDMIAMPEDARVGLAYLGLLETGTPQDLIKFAGKPVRQGHHQKKT